MREALKGCIRQVTENEVAFVIRVKPAQKREGLVAASDGSIVLRVNAPAKEGRANVRVVTYLAQILRKPKKDIAVVRGELSPHKEIRVKNSSVDELINLLAIFVEKPGDLKT